jgi:hypothetical protein
MTRRTRLFLLVSGGILVAGLGTGLVAGYVGGFQNINFLGSSAPDELAYLPADAKVVAFANVREIMDSELHHKLQAMSPRNGNGLARFEEETGVDVTRDVDYVLAAIGGDTGPADSADANVHPPVHPLVVARGRFDNVRIEGLVRSKGGAVEDYKGVRLLTIHDARRANDGALAFVEPGLIAMGDGATVRRAVDARQGGRAASVAGNSELLRLVKDADNGNAWVVARFDALSSAGRLPAGVLQRLPAINWISVTGHVNGGIRAAVRAETRDDAAGKNLHDVLQGMLALVKLQAGQSPELATFVDSIELVGDGKNVSLGLSVPIEVVDRLASLRTPPAAAGAPDAPAPPVTAP